MDKEIFKQFEKQFGEEWVCSCGNPFKAEWVETISQSKGSFLAKYHCRICGQEQIFAASSEYSPQIIEKPAQDSRHSTLSSDDVLDIKQELSKISFSQVRSLGKRRSPARVSATQKHTK